MPSSHEPWCQQTQAPVTLIDQWQSEREGVVGKYLIQRVNEASDSGKWCAKHMELMQTWLTASATRSDHWPPTRNDAPCCWLCYISLNFIKYSPEWTKNFWQFVSFIENKQSIELTFWKQSNKGVSKPAEDVFDHVVVLEVLGRTVRWGLARRIGGRKGTWDGRGKVWRWSKF